jgi:hypothetical protein
MSNQVYYLEFQRVTATPCGVWSALVFRQCIGKRLSFMFVLDVHALGPLPPRSYLY